MEKYKVVFSANAMNDMSAHIRHYGVKGMRWGVVNEEKPVGPTRGPVMPLTAQTGPKPKVASQNVSTHRYQDILKQINARSTSTNNQQASNTNDPYRYREWSPVFNMSQKKDRPTKPYEPKNPVESVPDQWDIWASEIPEFDPSNEDFYEYQKYGGFIANAASSFAEFLKHEGISQISDITDPALAAYDIKHYKQELERIISDTLSHSPYLSPHWNNIEQHAEIGRTDFLLALKRNGFDFFTPEEKFRQKILDIIQRQRKKFDGHKN